MSITLAQAEGKPLLWTRSEVANALRVSLRQTYELQRRGFLTPIKLGAKSVRFRPEQVQQLSQC